MKVRIACAALAVACIAWAAVNFHALNAPTADGILSVAGAVYVGGPMTLAAAFCAVEVWLMLQSRSVPGGQRVMPPADIVKPAPPPAPPKRPPAADAMASTLAALGSHAEYALCQGDTELVRKLADAADVVRGKAKA